jgi:hypothetical protein
LAALDGDAAQVAQVEDVGKFAHGSSIEVARAAAGEVGAMRA